MQEGILYFMVLWVFVVTGLYVLHILSAKPDPGTAEMWHKDTHNWKMGLFYYNPADPRIFPPKRSKSLGWTVNFGNRASIVAFIMLMAALIYFIASRL